MHHAWKYQVAVLLSLLCGPCGVMAREGAHVDAAAYEAWQQDAVANLSAMPDTDALVTAGVLAGMSPNGKARFVDLLDRAVTSAPQAADIGLLDIMACTEQPGCDALQREVRMHSVDPRNGNFWIVALHDASEHADQTRIDTALTGMAQSTSFDLYSVSLGRRMLLGLKRIPPAPGFDDTPVDVARQVQARTLVLAVATPAMQDLVEACRPGTPAGNTRRKTCRAIANSLRHSDSLITNMIGLRLQEWTASDATDRNDALAGRRRLEWKMSQLRDVSDSVMPPVTRMGTLLAHKNEVDGIDAVLRATGRPLDPPAGWQPSHQAPASTARGLH